jgi:hypothetical protein
MSGNNGGVAEAEAAVGHAMTAQPTTTDEVVPIRKEDEKIYLKAIEAKNKNRMQEYERLENVYGPLRESFKESNQQYNYFIEGIKARAKNGPRINNGSTTPTVLEALGTVDSDDEEVRTVTALRISATTNASNNALRTTTTNKDRHGRRRNTTGRSSTRDRSTNTTNIDRREATTTRTDDSDEWNATATASTTHTTTSKESSRPTTNVTNGRDDAGAGVASNTNDRRCINDTKKNTTPNGTTNGDADVLANTMNEDLRVSEDKDNDDMQFNHFYQRDTQYSHVGDEEEGGNNLLRINQNDYGDLDIVFPPNPSNGTNTNTTNNNVIDALPSAMKDLRIDNDDNLNDTTAPTIVQEEDNRGILNGDNNIEDGKFTSTVPHTLTASAQAPGSSLQQQRRLIVDPEEEEEDKDGSQLNGSINDDADDDSGHLNEFHEQDSRAVDDDDNDNSVPFPRPSNRSATKDLRINESTTTTLMTDGDSEKDNGAGVAYTMNGLNHPKQLRTDATAPDSAVEFAPHATSPIGKRVAKPHTGENGNQQFSFGMIQGEHIDNDGKTVVRVKFDDGTSNDCDEETVKQLLHFYSLHKLKDSNPLAQELLLDKSNELADDDEDVMYSPVYDYNVKNDLASAMNRVRIDDYENNGIDGVDDKDKVTATASSSMEEVNHNLQGNHYDQESHQNNLSEFDGLDLDFSSEYHPLDGSLENHLDLEFLEFLSEWYHTKDTTEVSRRE